MNLEQCQNMCDALNEMEKSDYFAVYVKRSAKDRGSFLLNVLAKGKSDALRIARQHGHKLPRWSYAVHIGRDGYFNSLRRAFPA